MKSEEGVIWCWKNDSDNTLFIFREEGKEIEVNLDDNSNKSNKLLLRKERQFLTNLKDELNGR